MKLSPSFNIIITVSYIIIIIFSVVIVIYIINIIIFISIFFYFSTKHKNENCAIKCIIKLMPSAPLSSPSSSTSPASLSSSSSSSFPFRRRWVENFVCTRRCTCWTGWQRPFVLPTDFREILTRSWDLVNRRWVRDVLIREFNSDHKNLDT